MLKILINPVALKTLSPGRAAVFIAIVNIHALGCGTDICDSELINLLVRFFTRGVYYKVFHHWLIVKKFVCCSKFEDSITSHISESFRLSLLKENCMKKNFGKDQHFYNREEAAASLTEENQKGILSQNNLLSLQSSRRRKTLRENMI